MAVPVKVNSNILGMDYRVKEFDSQDGDDGQVGALSGSFDYPVVYDQVSKKYVEYGAAGHAVAADVEGCGHDGHGHSLQQGDVEELVSMASPGATQVDMVKDNKMSVVIKLRKWLKK